jgi:hypothetical protein
MSNQGLSWVEEMACVRFYRFLTLLHNPIIDGFNQKKPMNRNRNEEHLMGCCGSQWANDWCFTFVIPHS